MFSRIPDFAISEESRREWCRGHLKVALGKLAVRWYHSCPSYCSVHELILLSLQNAFMILAHLLRASPRSLFHGHSDFLIWLLNCLLPVFAGL